MTNLRHLGMAMHLYTEESNGFFPAHRGAPGPEGYSWWGTKILDYAGKDTHRFRCPDLKGRRVDRGTRWEWRFDVHSVGYGYNGFFLGPDPYTLSVNVGGINFAAAETFNLAAVKRPSENLLLAERSPTGNPAMWGSVLWWPNACMDGRRSTSRTWEGVETNRHSARGAVVLNDGHVEFRRDEQINPPYDPNSGNAKALTNSKYWDPLQRAGDR